VVRAMARSDHWRCVSTPRCARTWWKVPSICGAPGKPEQDLDRIGLPVGAEQGLGRKLAQGIADEHPPDGHRDTPRVVPEGISCDRLEAAVAVAVPAGKRDGRPDRRWIGAYLVQGRHARPHDAGTPVLVWETRRRWSHQTCIQAQAGNDGRDRPRPTATDRDRPRPTATASSRSRAA
jgi:hypothetical protein